MDKFTILGIISIIMLIVGLSGCTNQNKYNTYNDSYISFDYPNNWYKTPSQGNVSVFDLTIPVKVVIGDNTNSETGILVIESKNTTLEEIKSGILKYGVLTSESNTTVNNIHAHELVYNTTLPNKTVKKEKMVFFEKNNKTYIIIFTALPQDFDRQQTNFQIIQNSFKVQ